MLMNTLTLRNSKLAYLLIGIILFVSFAFVLSAIGYYNFCYIEQGRTFLYHSAYIGSTASQPGGCIQLLSDFLIQFFVYPSAGIVITALLLTLIAVLTAHTLHRHTESRWLLPLALLPVIPLACLHYNTNYQYAGTMAFLLMTAFLSIQTRFRRFAVRLGYSVISTLLLFVMAGPVALLYGCCLLILELFRNYKQAVWFVALPLLAYLCGKACLWMGLAGELKHVLLPDGYFTLRLQAGSIVCQPWIMMAGVCLATGVSYKLIRIKSKRWQSILIILQLAGIGLFAANEAKQYVSRSNEAFKELDYHARNEQWDTVIEKCKHLSMSNLLFQNYLHMALAEKGRLADELFRQPCIDIRSIYVSGNKTPYVSTLLSDIYFSMGHIAFAQRCAFEGNEGWGNFSPRMLQRLIQTNLIYGQYEVARKYIEVLEATFFYKDLATSYRRFLHNDAAVEADSLLGSKRNCLFPDNRFAGSKGLDDDLKEIVLHNPSHKATILYLGSLYLLSKDIPRFQSTLETFYGTPALPAVLPVCFQEGVAVFAAGNPDILQRYNIQAGILQRFNAFNQGSSREQGSLWHFLKYRN